MSILKNNMNYLFTDFHLHHLYLQVLQVSLLSLQFYPEKNIYIERADFWEIISILIT